MGIPWASASASMAGQFCAASCGVMFDWFLKLGSLKPIRYFDPLGMGPPSAPLPQIIGTNSMPAAGSADGSLPQSYHHEIFPPKASPGAAFDAMPRLHVSGGPESWG